MPPVHSMGCPGLFLLLLRDNPRSLGASFIAYSLLITRLNLNFVLFTLNVDNFLIKLNLILLQLFMVLLLEVIKLLYNLF